MKPNKQGYKFNNYNSMLSVLREIKKDLESATHYNKNAVTVICKYIEKIKEYQKEIGKI